MVNFLTKITTPVFAFMEKLSKMQRIAVCAGAFVLLIGGFVGLSIYPKFTEINRLNKEIDDLDQKLTIAKRKAQQLAKFREMLKNKEADFKIAKKALPENKEIPSLLTGISSAGKSAGLEFFLFEPKGEVKKDFYAEIPVAIKVSGPYHNVAVFFDKVARLFRVVNISDFQMSSRKGTPDLDTACTAVTYRFLEQAAEQKTQEKGKKKK